MGATVSGVTTVLRRRGARSQAAMGALYLSLVVTAVSTPAARMPAIVAGMGSFCLMALILGVRSATRSRLPREARRAWWLLSGGILLLNLIPAGIRLSGSAASRVAETGLFTAPTYGDLIRLLAILPMLAGLISFPRSNITRRDGLKLALDVVTVFGGSFMVIWYFVLGPVVMSDLPVLTMVVAAAYPIGDLILIFGGTMVVLRGAHPATRRPMAVLVAGLSLLVVSDTYLGYCRTHPGVTNYVSMHSAVLMSGMFLLALAGAEQCRIATTEQAGRAYRQPLSAVTRLPFAALAAGSALLIIVALNSALFPWLGLIGGAVVMIAAAATRQFIAMRENHELVTRDSLTGLVNRVRLHEGMARAVERANRTGERAAVMLIDLDGFKQINDTLGHDAGDQLLVGFAGQLRNSTFGSDVVARLGGDEFAIVLGNVGTADNAAAIATRIITAMGEPVAVNGEPVCAAASIGIAVTRPDATVSPQELLHQADMAMYRAKARPGNNYVFFDRDPAVTHTG